MKVSILDRDWTPAESHRNSDHRKCGPSCQCSGIDLRESPVFDAVNAKFEKMRDAELTYAAENLLRARLADLSVRQLRAAPQLKGMAGVSRMPKAQLIDLIVFRTRAEAFRN